MTKVLLIASCGLLALIIGAKVFEQEITPERPVFIDSQCTEKVPSCTHAKFLCDRSAKKPA